jgi:hypothetical protein
VVVVVPSGVRVVILGANDGEAPLRWASGGALRWASGDGAPLGPSDGNAPEAGGQAAVAHPYPVPTVVAQGTIYFDSVGGGHGRRGWHQRSCEARSSPARADTRGVGGSGVLR